MEVESGGKGVDHEAVLGQKEVVGFWAGADGARWALGSEWAENAQMHHHPRGSVRTFLSNRIFSIRHKASAAATRAPS